MKDLCYFYTEDVRTQKLIVILYPSELDFYYIMKDNLKEMEKYVFDYIEAEELRDYYQEKILKVPFDSLKDKYAVLRDELQKDIDRLSEKMNVGISPYAWYSKGKVDGMIDETRIKADYSFVLEKV